jgi:menaquinone-specific isochorismate synthase
MVTANAIQQILSSPGALAQDFDGSFFVLTNCKTEISLGTSLNRGKDTNFTVLSPTFFGDPSKDGQQFQYCLKFERNEFVALLRASLSKEEGITNIFWTPASRSEFDEDFQAIQSAINDDLIEKAVVMTTEAAEVAPSPPQRMRMLLNLLVNCPLHLYIYGWWDELKGVLGATPEILFRREGRSLLSMALAGTLPKLGLQTSTPDGQTLLQDSKELHEHQLVIDDLREKLGAFAVNHYGKTPKIRTYGPEVIELPHLFHLHTRIETTLSKWAEKDADATDIELVHTLHPSSALGLRSRRVSWEWLKKLNGHQNLGHFGAPFGMTLTNGFWCLVGIRNLEWNEQNSYLRAGCGIVRQSQADREWEELRAKRESVKALLGIS